MRTMKGPGLFLAQFATDTPPHNTLAGIAKWAKDYGYKAIQIPTWDSRFFDLDRAYDSETYCDEIKGKLADIGIAISEFSTHFQGQMVSVHPAYDAMFDGQCPAAVRGNPEKRRLWAAEQVRKAARVSRRFGLTEHVTFTGSLAWPYFYPYPQRPAGLIEECFAEQGRRWKPILDVYRGERRRPLLRNPSQRRRVRRRNLRHVSRRRRRPQALQHQLRRQPLHQAMHGLSRLHRRLSRSHQDVPRQGRRVQPDGEAGVYGGYKGWLERAGRDRSLGDGQVNFKAIFSKLAAYDFAGWAVYEWECCLQHPEVAARKGAKFIANHIIEVTDRVFDDFAATGADRATNLKLLGIKG